MLAELCTALLPSAPQLRLDALDLDPQSITLHVTSIQVAPACPDCGSVADRPHSSYVRALADLPWADLLARIRLRVRRFFCDHRPCPRTTFTERLPALVAPHARRTGRLATAQAAAGLALGGAAGARLAAKHHMPTSRNTILRLIRRVPPPPVPAPRVIGLDDWAKRKGHQYGTIVVDLETHAPIDLLDDRLAETVTTWLQAHATVEVISRDRAGAYAAGATAGAPTAIQVADRFHLLKNLRETIELELSQRGARIVRTESDATGGQGVLVAPVPATTSTLESANAPAGSVPATHRALVPDGQQLSAPPLLPDALPIYPATPTGRQAETARQVRRNERFTQYTELIALCEQGLDQAMIARRVGLSQRTVSRWLAAEHFPERKPRSGDASSLDPYKPYLLERWEAGCHNGTQLWRAIQAQGFAGCYGIVADFLAPLRRGEAVQAAPPTLPLSVAAPTPLWYTARQAAFLFLRPPAELTPSEQEDLLRMQVQDDSLTTIYGLTQDFAAMLRERQGEHLDGWLARAETSGCPELQRFANGIRRDEAAVRAGLTLAWSQGPVEGQVTRLKLVKRQMYGRAKLDLLRQRVLHAA